MKGKDIEESINKTASTAAAEPGGFPAILLKTCQKGSVKTSAHITINENCFDLGVTKLLSKKSHIVPIHKGGSNVDPGNYRPVSVTSHI